MALKYGLALSWLGILWMGWGQEAGAGMIGSPIALHPKGTMVGAIEGNIIHRELAFDTGSSPEISITKLLLRGTYGVMNRANLFLTLGTVDDDFQAVSFCCSPPVDVKFLADQAIAYGGGFKVTVYEISNLLVGAGGQYERFTLDGQKSTSRTPSDGAELAWQELRVFAGVHLKDVPYFVPYGGLYLTVVRGELSFSGVTLPATDVEESQSVGLFYGGDFKVWKELVVSAEIHLIAETSVAFSLRYAF